MLAISKQAQSLGIKVLLTGDGADEAFGGYSWYPHLTLSSSVRNGENEQKEDYVSFQNLGLSINDRLSILASYPRKLRAWAWHYYASEKEKEKLFSSDLFGEINSSIRHFESLPENSDNPMDFIRHDRDYYFPFEMLRKADRMTMAHSVEGRVLLPHQAS